MDYGHGSSLTTLLRPREEMQAQPGETLATTKCQVNPQEPAFWPPGHQDTSYYPTSLNPQQYYAPPQHCLGLDIVASHLTSSHSGHHQAHLSSSGHLTRPRQHANIFSSLSSSSTCSPPTSSQHFAEFPKSLQFSPETLSPGSHQYTLPCNRRLSQPASVHLENAWNHLEPPERFLKQEKQAGGPFENTAGVQQGKLQQQPRKAALPPTHLHLSQL